MVKYNLGFIDGQFGNGKTGFLTYLGATIGPAYKRVYSNFKINLENAVYLDTLSAPVLLSLNKDRAKCLMLLHEGYHYFDKWEWNRKKNKEITQALFQIRKLNIDIFVDIPRLDYLINRGKIHGTHYFRAYGEMPHINNGEVIEESGIFKYKVMEYDKIKDMFFPKGQAFYLPLYEIYNLYDTFERKLAKQTMLMIDDA